jgi:hypothetical protein
MGFLFVIWVGIAWALYREAKRFAQQNGAFPWSLPPFFWGLVGLMGGLLGALVMLIAEKTTTKRVPNNVVWSQGQYVDPRFAAPQHHWSPCLLYTKPIPPDNT